MTTSRLTFGVVALLLPAAAGAADFGTLTKEGEAATLTSTCAYVPRYDMQGWGKPAMTVLLSDRPLDCAAAQQWAHPDSAAFDEVVRKGRGSLLSISFKDDLKIGKVSYYAPGATLGNDDCAGCASTVVAKGTALEGSIKTTEPLMLNSSPVTFDVRLNVARPAPPAAGDKLPPGGGDPGKAYLAYLKAHQEGDYAALQTLMPDGKAEEEWGYYEDEAERKKQIQGEDKAKSASVVEGFRVGDGAILVVEVPHPWRPGAKLKSAVGLGLAGGTWRVREERLDLGGSMFQP